MTVCCDPRITERNGKYYLASYYRWVEINYCPFCGKRFGSIVLECSQCNHLQIVFDNDERKCPLPDCEGKMVVVS